ncbi:ABC transporter substrate-binding protein [Pseudomonas sp. TE3610]
MHHNTKSISIAIDAFPYKNTIHTACDYGGQQIFGKCALPLFTYRNGRLVNLAANASQLSSDRRSLAIELRDDLLWSNGAAITARHYIEGFKEIIRSPSNRFCNLLSDIAGYKEFSTGQSDYIGITEINRRTLELKLRNINKWLPGMLSQFNLSPRCENPELSAGPYRIERQSSTLIELIKNKWHHAHTQSTADRLVFVNYAPYHDRSACIDDYYRGTIDITCDTVMRFGDYKHHRKSDEFHTTPTNLGVFLVPGTHFFKLPAIVRKTLSRAIDRHEISDALMGLARPLSSYTGLYTQQPSTPYQPCAQFQKYEITITYDEFYPNLIIAGILKAQLRKIGIMANLKAVTFGDWSATSELRLTINAPSMYGPLGFYKADLFKGHLNDEALAHAKILYSIYLSNLSADVEATAAAGMEKIISDEGLSIPLVTLPTAALVRRGICPKSFYEIGAPVKLC